MNYSAADDRTYLCPVALLNAHAEELVDGVVKYLKGKKVKPSFDGGQGAAQRVVRLMQETFTALPPQEIVDTYNEGTSPSDRLDMWTAFGDKTIERIGEGCLCLAEIWASPPAIDGTGWTKNSGPVRLGVDWTIR